MYAKTTILAALLAVAPVVQAQAQSPTDDSVAQLARDSGLSERNVRMILGAHTPYGEYRCCFSRMLRQFKEAVGEENYRRLADGRNMLRHDASTAARGADSRRNPLPNAGYSAL